MKLETPSSYRKTALQIASAWRTGGANFILVAPPLSLSEHIFLLLQDKSIQEECGLDIDSLAIAFLPPSSYSTSKEFVYRVLRLWEVDINIDSDDREVMDLLEEAIEALESQGRTPIILLPQFHKAVERLSWTLGSRLRELEVSYGLCTVVEVPVPLSQLRDRWEVIEGKETFICSDFGQGHSMLAPTGFNDHEILSIMKHAQVNPEYARIIQSWSGGVPELVTWLIREAKQANSVEELEVLARAGSVEQCQRFIGWLDAPNSKFFKELVSAVWLRTATPDQYSALREHDWRAVLVDSQGNLKSNAIGFACMNSGGASLTQVLASIGKALEHNEVEQTKSLVDGLSDALRKDQRIKIIEAVIPLCISAQRLSPNWDMIEKNAKLGSKLTKKSPHPQGVQISLQINTWYEFAKHIGAMTRATERNKDKDWRLSDSLSGRENVHTNAAVQLILYRISEANKLADANIALKSVLELPEQILQIYCGRKLNLSVWHAPDFSSDEIEQVQNLWQQGTYRIPLEGARLSLVDLVYFGWVRMQKIDVQERLFDNFSELKDWHTTYETARNQPAHSITFESEKSWRDFCSRTTELSNRLSRSLTGQSSKDLQPDLRGILLALISEEPSI